MDASVKSVHAFAPNVWIIDGPLVRDFGVLFTTRMTVVSLADGSIWIESPVSVPFETLTRLAAGCMAHALSRCTALGTAPYPLYVKERTPASDWHTHRNGASRLVT
jgi:hypothetical protein